jgi:phospholipase B1, membrane-associated
MPGQAQWLLEKLKANNNINFAEDWKMLTIWIGGNNLCDVCKDWENNNEIMYNTQLRQALTFIQENIPRVVSIYFVYKLSTFALGINLVH